MSIRTIPPEAYTHKELAEAMNWRETQPEYVKAMTSSPESLVSFYKRAQRTEPGKAISQGKVSDAFRSDLKTLAEGLKSFEMPINGTSNTSSTQREEARFQDFSSHYQPAPPQPQTQAQNPPQYYQPTPPPASPFAGTFTGEVLDEQTRALIHEVKIRFNLSSEQEVVRFLVKLGYDQARSLFSRNSPL